MAEKKFFWVDCKGKEPWNKRKKLVTTALESGAAGVIVNPEDLDKARGFGKIDLISTSEDSDIVLVGQDAEGDGTIEAPGKLGDSRDLKALRDLKRKNPKIKTCGYVEIRSKHYEVLAATEAFQGGSPLAGRANFIVVVGKDWEVIPLENLIAKLQGESVEILAGVKDAEEAKTALETLEIGVDGVLLQTKDFNTIKAVSRVIGGASEKIELKSGTVKTLKPVVMGDRVCIDTASLLKIGEGMLIGSQANGLFLVHSETLESEYVASRPFRVNAGAVHAYVLIPGGKTKYLSDLKAGDDVLAVDSKGNTRTVVVGRVKIEKRPLMLLEVESEGKLFKTLLQNAETITLVNKRGKPVSISRLKKGDEILLFIKEIGRHFGMEVKESLIER
jgi:3-dehydroquinate synthase II